jgi:predicted nucleic acid-binding protein
MDTADAGNEKPTVYIETSIVSYLTARPSRDLLVAAHQQLTVVWWDEQRAHYELFASQVVVAEARAGDPDAAQRRLVVLERLPLLVDVTDAAIALATLLITEQALPAQAAQDALHLALACVHGMQYLLTWNCTHLANAQLRSPSEQVCCEAGYIPPIICTPEELAG